MTSKKKRIIYISLIIGLYLGFEVYTFIKEIQNDLGPTKVPNKEYVKLLNIGSKSKLVYKYSNLNAKKSPVSFFEYADLDLIIYKIDSSNYYSLKNVMIVKTKNVVVGNHIDYLLFDKSTFELRHDISSDKTKIENVVFNLDDVLPKTLVKNDSMCFYQGMVRNLGLAYSQKGSNDMLITARKKHTPSVFGCISRKEQIYFILIVPNKKNVLIHEGILKELFGMKD